MRSFVIAAATSAAVAVACSRPPPSAPASAPPVPAESAVAATAVPAPAPATAPTPLPPLAASPSHRVVTWFVDAITHRGGAVTRDELAAYCDHGFLGPTARTAERFAGWAKELDGAVLTALEVDDVEYVSGILATADHRWKFIMNVDADGKLSYLRLATAGAPRP